MMNKKGDPNWFMVSMIIALIGFVVLVLVIYVFPWKQTIDRTACHESIVLRGTLTGDDLPLKNFVSVRCKSRQVVS